MSELVLYNTLDLKKYETRGKKLYKEDGNLKIIADLMEDSKFRKFFEEHFNSWSDIKIVIYFMKLYQILDKESPVKLNSHQKIALINQSMIDSKLRHKIIQTMSDWSNKEFSDLKQHLLLPNKE